jgi:hypothetical protein
MTFVEARQGTKFSLCLRVKTGFGIDSLIFANTWGKGVGT